MGDTAQSPATTIGVVGAGTMGSGIAQLAAFSGARALLVDPVPGAAERGAERARAGLAKGAERGRWSRDEADAAAAEDQPDPGLGELAAELGRGVAMNLRDAGRGAAIDAERADLRHIGLRLYFFRGSMKTAGTAFR